MLAQVYLRKVKGFFGYGYPIVDFQFQSDSAAQLDDVDRSGFVTAVVSGFQASSATLFLSYVLVPDSRIRSNILSQ
jgi:hypothetical protein